jgi:hypothetical protein
MRRALILHHVLSCHEQLTPAFSLTGVDESPMESPSNSEAAKKMPRRAAVAA